MFYRVIKRAFDILASTLALVVTSPVWLITVIGILVSDFGPIFYLANRVGRNDRVFRMYKFRSMRVDNAANEKSLRADQNRIFPFGRFIRAAKIDELPQLLNIFLGDMSVVGPRPASVDQVEIVRAGENAVTGTVAAGLSGPSALYDYIYGDAIEDETEYAEKVLPTRLKLDVWYVHNMSIAVDIRMIWWTVICVLAEVFRRPTPKIYNALVGYVAEPEQQEVSV